MSLTSCLAKANDFIDPALKSDLLARAKTLEARGQAAPGASRQAVQEAIDLLTRQLRVATNKAQEVRQSAPRNQTETPAFKKWFGESKIVNDDGSPRVVYHGTSSDFTEFDLDYSTEGGFFFSVDQDHAARFGSNTMPLYVSMRDPLMVKGDALPVKHELEDIERLIGRAKGGGHDGVFISGFRDMTEKPIDTYIAFEPEQIKAATGNNGEFDPASRDITRSAPRSPWYSGLQQAIEGVPERLAAMAAPQWRLWLDANAAKLGVKKDEIEWSGVKDFLATRGKDKVTKGEIAGYLAANGVKIEETVLGGRAPGEKSLEVSRVRGSDRYSIFEKDQDEPIDKRTFETFDQAQAEVDRIQPTMAAKYQDYTVPGGTNYREFLLTLPVKKDSARLDELREMGRRTPEEDAEFARELADSSQAAHYTSSHWDQKNVLAHLRVDDRTDADGNKVLMIQEIQSDWGADGRKKGFQTGVTVESDLLWGEWLAQKKGITSHNKSADLWSENGELRREFEDYRAGIDAAARDKNKVPSGPFVTDTKAYVALALKRAIKLAVDENYDRVAMVTGEQAADFFDLSKRIDRVDHSRNGDGTYNFSAIKDGSEVIAKERLTLVELEDTIGKDIAQKIVNGEGRDPVELDPVDRWEAEDTSPAVAGDFDYDKTPERSLVGIDLAVGGEGMKKYYNDLVPNVVRDVLKKLGGGKMEEISIQTDKQGWSITPPSQTVSGRWMLKSSDYNSKGLQFDTEAEAQAAMAERLDRSDQPGFTLTPAMKEKAEGGMVMFSAKRDSAAVRAGADAIAKLPRSVIDDLEPSQAPGGYASYALYEARKLMPKPSDKIKKVSDSNSLTLWQNYDWVANVDGELFGINKSEDPDYDPYGDKPETDEDDESTAAVETGKWNYTFSRVEDGVTDAATTWHFDKAELIKDIRASMNQRTAAADGSQDITQSTIRQKIDDAINQPTLSIVGETRRQHTPEQLAAMRRVGFQVETPSLKDRAKALTEGLGKRLAQGVFDQFAPIRDIDDHAYLLTRLSKGASGAFESFLHGGKLKLSDGVYDFDDQARGGVIDKLLTPLGGEHHDFFRWIAANRAERLTAEGKENLFSAEDIAALKTLAEGRAEFDYTLQHGARAGQTTRSRADIYADSLKTFNAFSDNIMDMAEQSGLIDGEARQFWEQEFYVPFYRVADEMEGGVRGMGSKGSMVRQEAFKKLKGGKNMLNADLLDNTLMNWAHLLDASAKNRAAKATLEAAVNLGVAIEANETTVKQMGKSAKTAPVWFMDSGKQRHFIVEDPMLLTAISSLEYAGMRNPVMNAMSMFKHVLTVGVTASPFFKIRNLIRDSVQVIGTSPIGYNPAGNLKQGWKLTDPKSDAYFRLLAGGGTIHFGSMLEGSEAKRVQALVESGVDRATILGDEHAVKAFYRKVIAPLVDGYNELGNRGEAVNRAAMYDQLVKGGMSHAEASLMARDSMDFSMAGSFTSIRFLTQILPFFNARLQGLYKLGKAAHEDPKRMAIVVGAVTLASLGLLAAYGDDDDWKKREEWDRNGFWWFKVGGIAYRIPKPFELGAIGTLAERGFEFMFDDEMTGKRLRSQVLTLLSDNLAMNPVPQAFKPILDIYANKDAFSGRPIETPSMEKLRPEYRFTDRTSMVARGASTALNSVTGLIGQDALSPVQIDQMLRGYFGWLGSFVVGSADVLARPLTDQPAQARPDLWKTATGSIISGLSDAPSRYVSQMYEQSKELEQVYGTHRMLLKAGKIGEAAEFKADHAEQLARHKHVENVKQAATRLNARRREIERSALDADAKREALRRISLEQDKIARLLK